MPLPWTSGLLTAPGRSGIYALIGGFDVERVGEPQSHDIHGCSVHFATNEYLANTTQQPLGFANAWTINIWAYTNAVGGATAMLELGGAADASRIRVDRASSSSFTVQLDNAAGTLFKNYGFGDGSWLTTSDQWTMFTVTWDGTNLRGYQNAIEDAAPTKTTDNSDSQANDNRDIYVGAYQGASAFYNGNIHSIIIWDVALTPDAIKEVWNHGHGAYFNPVRNSGDYSSGSDVVHWWRLGHDPSNIGRDWVATGGVDIDANAANITTADIERWFPGGGCTGVSTNELFRKGTAGAGGGTGTVQLGVADTYSIEVWARISTLGAQTVFDANEGDSDVGRDSDSRIQLRTFSSQWQFRAFDASGSGTTLTGSVNARIDEWYHIVMVKSGTSRMSLYINGVEDAFTTSSIPTQTDAQRIIGLGAIPITPSEFFDGQIHSCAVWDVALDSTNIKALYNGGYRTINRRRSSGGYTQAAALKHWWRCGRPKGSEGVGGDTITDQVATGGIDLTANASNIAIADTNVHSQLIPDGASVNFDGTNDYLANTSAQALGFGNTWTVACWVNPDTITALKNIFEFWNGSSDANRLDLKQAGTIAGDPWEILLYDGSATLFKQYRWGGALGGSWFHVAATWDGTTLKVYENGQEDAAPTKTTDLSGSQSDANRQTFIGQRGSAGDRRWDGLINCVMVWNSVLSANEICELYCKGPAFDPRTAGSPYSSQANLKHCWRPGQDPTDLGKDWVAAGAVNLTATSLDDTDIQIDSPVDGTV
jgi:hypothetical protein